MKGGDLFDRLITKTFYSEREARKVGKSLAESVRYLHEMDIVHRDIKLENILLKDLLDDTKCVLCDFGFAKKTKEDCRTDCGTRNYAAPEILMGKSYGKAVDVWALGIVLFTLATGYHPFDTGSTAGLITNVCSGMMMDDTDSYSLLSSDFKHLLQGILTVDPVKRMTIQQVCLHPWLLENDESE
jgi:serine/threonine protein kinase